MLFLYCNKENNIADDSDILFDRAVRITTNIDDKNEISRANFIGNDLSLTLDYGEDNELLHTNNRKWNYSDGVWSIEGEEYMLWKDNSTPVDVYAYSPYIEGVTDNKNISFQVKDNQSESNTNESDLLGCTIPQYKNNGIASLQLTFKHVLAQIKVNLTYGNSVGENPSASSFKIKNVMTGVSYDATTGIAISNMESKKDVTVAKSSNGNIYTAILPAQTLTGELIEITVNNNTYTYNINEGTIHELKAGNILTLNLQVGVQEIILKGVSVEDWNTQNISDMTATQKTWSDFAIKPSKGEGTSGEPYLIYNAAELAYIANEINNSEKGKGINIKLENDIDLSGLDWIPIGANSTNCLSGSCLIDGNNKKIIGMSAINQTQSPVSGFIGYAKTGVKIANLIFENPVVRANSGATSLTESGLGTVIGFAKGSCIISNCHVTGGYVQGPYNSGGLAGKISGGTILYASSYNGTIYRVGFNSGSIVGEIGSANVIACYSTGIIRGTNGYGAAIGKTGGGNISLISTYTTVTPDAESAFVATLTGTPLTITSCYAQANNKITNNNQNEIQLVDFSDSNNNETIISNMNETIDKNQYIVNMTLEKFHYEINNDVTTSNLFPFVIKKFEE